MPRASLAAALAALLAGTAVAQSPPASAPVPPALAATPPASAPLPPAELRAVVGQAVAAGQAEDCPRLLSLLDPVVPRVAGRERLTVQMLRVACLGRGARAGEVPAVYADVAAIDALAPAVQTLGVVVAVQAADWPAAAARLTTLAERAPGQLATINGLAGQLVLQGLHAAKRYDARDRLLVALADADWQPADQPDLREGLVHGAIEADLAADRPDRARARLDAITAPELLAGMAMTRHFEPLWPDVAARLGPNSGLAVDRFAAPRLDRVAAAPADPFALREGVRAMILLGRADDAIRMAAPVTVRDGIGEDEVVTLRYAAQALASVGRRDAAIERLAPFARIDLARTPDALSALIMTAELLQEAGRPADALTLARATLTRMGKAVSPWGVGWLRRSELCALSALGRTDEARPIGDALRAAADANPPAAVEGLLCAGRVADASTIAVATLGTREGASQLIDQFQPADALWSGSNGYFRTLWAGLLARPEVAAAFARAGRLLPADLRPAPAPRPVPRVAAPGGTFT